MKTNTFKYILSVALPLVIICVVAAGLLGAANALTKTKIEQNEVALADSARRAVLPEAEIFEERFLVSPEGGEIKAADYYVGKNAKGEIVGYTVQSSAKGYGGDIILTTGFNAAGEITAVRIVSCADETPGLGQNIQNESFLMQFKGKNVAVGYAKAGQAKAENDIDALASATFSTAGVVNAVNRAIDLIHNQVLKGGRANG
jgi:electron transport complex protein RnfG